MGDMFPRHHLLKPVILVAKSGIKRQLRKTASKTEHLGGLVPKELKARAIADIVFVVFAMWPGAVDEIQYAAVILSTSSTAVWVGRAILANAPFLHTFFTAFFVIGTLIADAVGTFGIAADRGWVGHILVVRAIEVDSAQSAFGGEGSGRHVGIIGLD